MVIFGVTMVVIMAISGPFGTYDDISLPLRFVFWTLALLAIAPIMELAIAWSLQAKALENLPKFLRPLAAVLTAAAPAAAAMLSINSLFRPQHGMWDAFPITWLSIAVIGLTMGAIRYRHEIWGDETSDAMLSPESRPLPPFFNRLPDDMGKDLISISINEHYLDVVTGAGATIMRMRFSDAVNELDGFDGTRIHRSHWVAKAHAGPVVRRGSGYQMRLADGRVLPVSRSRLREARKLVD